ncbi:MAG: extracellular solute-binding protein [Oscillospiraceae bacterium]|nr:extracellular solute-binding protein [Oscillospiraceae bacterium]
MSNKMSSSTHFIVETKISSCKKFLKKSRTNGTEDEMKHKIFLSSAIIFALICLSACGGGGDKDMSLRVDEAVAPVSMDAEIAGAVSFKLEKITRPENITDLSTYCDVYSERIYVFATQENGIYVMSIDTASGAWDTVCPAFGASALALDANGNVWMLGVDDDEAAHLYCCVPGNTEPSLAVELSSLGVAQGGYPEALAFDSGGILYMLWSNPKAGGSVSALDVSGDTPRELFKLSTGDTPKLARAGERVFVGSARDGVYELQAIDAEAQSWANSQSVDADAYGLAGGADGKLYLTIGGEVYSLYPGDGALTKLFSLTEMGVSAGFACGALSDGTPIVLSYESGGYYVPPTLSLARIEEAPAGGVTTLRLATTDVMSVRQAVLDFNESSDDVKIELVDYSVYNSEYGDTAGALRLATEIITGNAPDIYSLYDLPFAQYAAKGLLENLYPYIEADPELDRADFLSSIFAASEYDGKLMALVPSFTIQTMIARADMLPASGTWTLEDMARLMTENPDAAQFDVGFGRDDFLRYVVEHYGASFIDWESGTCAFDSPEFVAVLELAENVRENIGTGYEYEAHAVSAGAQLFSFYTVYSFSDADHFRTFGAEVSAPGFPSSQGGGNSVVPALSLGISSACADKNAAWSFLRGFLLESYQLDVVNGFPISKAALEAKAQRYRDIRPEGKEVKADYGSAGIFTVIYDPERDNAETLSIIDSARSLRAPDKALEEIIMDEAAAYFAGDKSAEETAKTIQSRVSIYLSEQYG